MAVIDVGLDRARHPSDRDVRDLAVQSLPSQGVHCRARARNASLGVDARRKQPANTLPMWSRMIDLSITGRAFGDLTALRPDGKDQWGLTMWLCLCACGEHWRVRRSDLMGGNTTSCGCRRIRVARELVGVINSRKRREMTS
jgi:hypothetical protein